MAKLNSSDHAVTYEIELKGFSPIGFNGFITTDKKSKETNDDFEKRTWKDRGHYTTEGIAYMPAIALKRCLEDAAKYTGDQIPGQGKKTYTAKMKAGLFIDQDMILGVHRDEIQGVSVMVPSSGVSGDGKRVKKTFPVIHEWKTKVRITVLDGVITEDVLRYFLDQAGKFIGLGAWRPANGGMWGRFSLEKIHQV